MWKAATTLASQASSPSSMDCCRAEVSSSTRVRVMSAKSSGTWGRRESPLSLGHHEGIGHQQLQGLAQGPGADFVLILEVLDPQLVAGTVDPSMMSRRSWR
jgi:hypothetical protein